VSYYAHFCEGCGHEKVIRDDRDFDPSPPLFWGENNDGCGCTKRRELTEYSDPCKKCGAPIYLTPGGAMRKKYTLAEGNYQQRKEYCDACLDEVVASAPCRNVGCKSIGGAGLVEATFGDKLFYEKKQFTFPPNNCEVCRKAVKLFKEREEVRPTCALCKKPFRVTYGVMIMILKNEEKCEIPKECLRCRGLAPDERNRMSRENELDDLGLKRRKEVAKILAGDKQALLREKERLVEAKQMKKGELIRLLNQRSKLKPSDLRAVLQVAAKDEKLLKILANRDDAGYRHIQEALAHITGGKGKMTDKEFAALPQAFHSILKDHPNAMGLFEKAPAHRAPGMSPVNQHYEILSAAALKTRNFTTVSGKKLEIRATDRVDFGIKFPHGHAQAKRHGTIEADTLVTRKVGIPPFEKEEQIAIDAKYRNTDKNRPFLREPKYDFISDKHRDEVKRQLEGIRTNFQNGNLHEFHFVTNVKFGDKFKSEVDQTNLRLVQDYITEHNKQFSSPQGIKELAHLHEIEKEAMPEGIVDPSKLGNLEIYSETVKEFAAHYKINQVEMCEHVTYPET
jgi:hypothetical protein